MANLAVNEHYEIRVQAQAQGQSIQNIFHYRVDLTNGNTTLEEFTEGFQDMWQGQICPLLHEDYSVVSYVGLHISGARFLPGVPDPPYATRLAYDELHAEQPVAADVGQKATDPLPTFAAAGWRKSCGVVRNRDGTFQVNGGILSGSWRLGPIVKADTEAGDGNTLTDAFVTAAILVVPLMLTLSVDGGQTVLKMEVISIEKDNAPRLTGGGLPDFATADVNGMIINSLVTSQVSRKARIRYG